MSKALNKAAKAWISGLMLMAAWSVAAEEGNFDKSKIECLQASEFYIAKFAVYQEDPNKDIKLQSKPYCVDVPLVGPAHINFDLLDRDVRKKPVSIKVVGPDAAVLAETPMKVATTGIARGDVVFPAVGVYDVILRVGDENSDIPPDVSAIHVSVKVGMGDGSMFSAIKQFSPWLQTALKYLLILAGVSGFGYLAYRLLKSRLPGFLDNLRNL